ncbi:aminotransferase class V-fold PLP-dependent enzyme [Candidatus Pelagibacter sp.]|nr:aminotransferase class V-fold PLP-dependent enzyme [Candidatus Pelagibacter sp.]
MIKNNTQKYSLLEMGFNNQDLKKGIEVLKSGFITMNKETEQFEKNFAKKLRIKYALMVNSGSSANLLAAFAACNPLRENRFKRGDHALIPALCWSTSLWPLVQSGLKPKFIDVDPKTLNLDADHMISKITKKTKVIMLVNVLGISANNKKIINYAKKKNIIVLEDNCEALGAKYGGKFLGTFGDFGTFSFFYSHQITSGEGGMIVCNNKKDYEILLALRSHGWSRGKGVYEKNAKKYPSLDPRYIFINSGFNLRPTDIQAAIANNQFKRLETFRKIRSTNKNKIIDLLKKDKRWNNQFKFVEYSKKIKASYMVLPILIDRKFLYKKKKFINFLEKKGLETRPVISGSFVNQPSSELYNLNPGNQQFKGAQEIQDLSFVIGLHTKNITMSKLKFIIDLLFSIDTI